MRTLIKMCAVTAALALSACEQPLEPDSDVPEGAPIDEIEQPLFGSIQTTNCDGGQAAILTNAVNLLRAKVQTVPYMTCIKDSFVIDHFGRAVEEIMIASRTQLPVSFTCTPTPCGNPGIAACAGPIANGAPESMEIRVVANAPVKKLAGTIIHEVMHNHSFMHPHQRGFAASDAVDRCIVAEAPFSIGRTDLSDQATLSHVGGRGGLGRTLSCPDGTVATGVRGRVDGRLERYGLRCSPISDDALGNEFDPEPIDASQGGALFANSCPPGKVVVGGYFIANQYVNRAWARCKSLDWVLGQSANAAASWIGGLGVSQGSAHSRDCPRGKVVVGLEMADGVRLDRLRLVCDDARRGRERSELTQAAIGGNGGYPVRERCSGNGVLTGLYGQRSNVGLHNLGGECQQLVGDDLASPFRLEPFGAAGGTRFGTSCPAGQVMVGVRARANNEVRDAGPLCVDYVAWRDSNAQPIMPAGAIQGNVGTLVSRTCARGEVAVGFEARAAARVDQIRLICQEPEAATTSHDLTAQGGNGGSPFTMRCGGDGPLRGLTGWANGRVQGIGGLCAPMRGDNAPAYTRGDLIPKGGTAGVKFSDACPANSVLVGITGREGGVVTAVRGVCAPLATWRTQTGNQTTLLPQHGNNGGSFFSQMCPQGEAVVGFKGREGALVDQIQPVCGTLDVLPGESIDGTLSGAGDVHIYRVAVPAGSENLRVTLTGPNNADFDLYVRQGLRPMLNRFDARGFTGSSNEHVILVGSEEDIYFVMVRAYNGAGNFTLTIDDNDSVGCNPSPEICNGLDDNCDEQVDEGQACATTVTVEVEQLIALSQDSCNGLMDFYSQITVDSIESPDSNVVDFPIVEGNNIQPGWAVSQLFAPAVGTADITLRIKDEDDAFCGGGDDFVDVHPAGNLAVPHLRVDFQTGQVHFVENGAMGQVVGQVDESISMQGTNSAERGRITFRVTLN